MEDDEGELRNPFPSPPAHYNNYTDRNLELLALLKERAVPYNEDINQNDILSDQTDVPSWPLVSLQPPRVDWMLEDGHYDVFGDRWFVKETIPSLAELGGHQLYPADSSEDRRPALVGVLNSILATYSTLTKSLLSPPPQDGPPEWKRHVEWITILAQNIMAAANDLRPVQARGNLEIMMQRQLELRREETAALHTKCDALEAKLSQLRNAAQDLAKARVNQLTSNEDLQRIDSKSTVISLEDFASWAEEIE